ncbi:hypothetical protein C0Z11_09440 [Acidipropionibacterium jensenii]|uniref:hypothetical protein n=1 Tax=Acidipropionibacterium jensenii TaxID=1749 RepID=UPI000BC2F87A|nr:hypothetical protein [Acidipropionibacterium jensenii]AZZ42469.1 hypothetical protein C0Z11_09440 [Acidipropionibacterium jensenii]
MRETCLQLTSLLNDLCAGRISAPMAEDRLGPMHQVHDPDGLLQLSEQDPLASVPVRRALTRIAHWPGAGSALWAMVLTAPGRLAGLRGPAEFNADVLEAGTAVICHTSGPAGIPAGLCWIPQPVGPAIQWRIVQGRPPIPPATPAEAGQQLRQVMAEVSGELGRLDIVTGSRPESVPPRLGRGHRHSDQVLLDLAWTALEASESGLESSPMLTSHGSQVRESALRRLRAAAQDAVTAATAWPRGDRAPGRRE